LPASSPEQSKQSRPPNEFVSFPDIMHQNDDPFIKAFDGISLPDQFVSSLDTSGSVTGLRPFICSVPRCAFRSSDWTSIVKHRTDVHGSSILSRKNSCCSVCGKVFGWKYIRDRHLKTHTRRSKIYCPGCSTLSPFRRQDNYIRHRRKKHGELQGSVTPHSNIPPKGCTVSASLGDESKDMVFVLDGRCSVDPGISTEDGAE